MKKLNFKLFPIFIQANPLLLKNLIVEKVAIEIILDFRSQYMFYKIRLNGTTVVFDTNFFG